ncbi:MAG: SHOCT domain-containing protein [Clostridiales bacterium]|nr:SHOCT domain-containing protein [Clostridiales bacterium]
MSQNVGLIILAAVLLYVILIILYVRKSKARERDFKARVESYLRGEGFQVDKAIDQVFGLLRFDYRNRRGAFLPFANTSKSCLTPMADFKLFSLDKVTECALVQDGTMVHHNAVLPGMVGAAAFGLAGALAGATATNRSENVGHLSIRVFIDDLRVSSLTINILNASIKKSDQVYLDAFALAQKIYNEFEGIVRLNQRGHTAPAAVPAAAPAASPAPVAGAHPAAPAITASAPQSPTGKALTDNERILEQVRRLAQMHQDGILTDAEFAEKKKLYMDKIV